MARISENEYNNSNLEPLNNKKRGRKPSYENSKHIIYFIDGSKGYTNKEIVNNNNYFIAGDVTIIKDVNIVKDGIKEFKKKIVVPYCQIKYYEET